MPKRRLTKNNSPQEIKAELVEIGDNITVYLPESGGIIMTKTGTIGKRHDHGDMRSYLTEEGMVLFTFQPGKPRLVKLTLNSRTPVENETLFEVA